jgi:phosphoenolpyruvate-protein kinase (PTS system EI component)
VGPALVLAPQQITYVRRALRSADLDGEIERFRAAVQARRRTELRAMGERSSAQPQRAEHHRGVIC